MAIQVEPITLRQGGLVTAVLVFALTCTTTGRALDCLKVVSASDKAICASSTARKSDEAMSKAYFGLLASLPSRDEKDSLIASQRRWLKARRGQDGALYGDSPGGFSGVLERQLEERRALFVSRAGAVLTVVARLERQRALLRAHPGRLAGFGAECFMMAPNFADGVYYCNPIIALQKGDRLCRWETEWATGHETEVWTVAKVESDRALLLATCKIGYAGGPECAGMEAPQLDVGWSRTPGVDTPKMSDLAKKIRPLDPDVDAELNARMNACLSEAEFPSPDGFADEVSKKH